MGTAGISSSAGTTNFTIPSERNFRSDDDEGPNNPHEKGKQTFARYFANELAQTEIYKAAPNFPVGSIIVREKLLQKTDEKPELVTVMIKREKGFSKKTGDWEFFVVQGDLGKIRSRETKGDCAKCHIQAEKTDWVFKTYLQ